MKMDKSAGHCIEGGPPPTCVEQSLSRLETETRSRTCCTIQTSQWVCSSPSSTTGMMRRPARGQ
jgi:hypothetical protein